MPVNILMPALSPTMEKGNLAKWLKKEGDPVKTGDVIAEIETDKATMEYEAIEDGTLAKIVVPDGSADVAVNQVIGIIAGEGEDTSAVKAPASAKPAPGDHAGRDGQHILGGAAKLDPAHVGGAIGPEGGRADRLGKRGGQCLVGGRQRDRGRQAMCHVGREARPG